MAAGASLVHQGRLLGGGASGMEGWEGLWAAAHF